MTTDIKTIWEPDKLLGDWQTGSGGLLDGNDLETAILISLFTDRLARADDAIDSDDRRGWWGDTGSEYPIGSRLWLLRREKLTTKVALKAEDYAAEALAWLIDDGVVTAISANAQIIYPNRLNLLISYQQPAKTQASVKFSWVWEA
ncbi:TPA: phage GP46 family protein [Yersinia enterocolitica]|nr:phage GP46 family protein [Yersinia enterocolitica]HDL8026123.1 phage GP46 family protein [Yersinia enterocolitica]HDL8160807.1 phage GP46 family protein [Yersinia enterocolitica]HDL8164653.1 phage GP46 family protein [Yersinia enterocolitica]HDL8168699.1 phage GP46 family protein [Yersinia enterocolitica]